MNMPTQVLRNWIAAAFLALTPSLVAAAPLPVIAHRSMGEVTRDQGAAIEGVIAGQTISAGTRIRTGADGRAEFSFQDAPTLKLGGNADLLLHSADTLVLRAKLHGGALSIDSTAGETGRTRDVRLNAGEMRLRVNAAKAWVELGPQSVQVCVISGVIEAQSGGQPARLDTPGQCLRKSGATATWTMVPDAVLVERVALTQAAALIVAVPAPKIEIAPAAPVAKIEVALPVPAVTSESEPVVKPLPLPPKPEPSLPAPEKTETAAADVSVSPSPPPVVAPEPKPVPPAGVEAPNPTVPVVAAAVLRVPDAVPVVEVPVLPPVVEPKSVVVILDAVPQSDAKPEAIAETPKPTPPAAEVAPAVAVVAELRAPATEAVQVAVVAPVAETAVMVKPSAAPEAAAIAAPDPAPEPPLATQDVALGAPAVEPVADDGRRWSVVLASFPLKETAEVEAARLKTMGLQADVREYRVGERHGFRVGLGRYAARQDADRALAKLLRRDPELVGWLAKY